MVASASTPSATVAAQNSAPGGASPRAAGCSSSNVAAMAPAATHAAVTRPDGAAGARHGCLRWRSTSRSTSATAAVSVRPSSADITSADQMATVLP